MNKKYKKDKHPRLTNTILALGIILILLSSTFLVFSVLLGGELPLITFEPEAVTPRAAFEYNINDTWIFIDIRSHDDYLQGHIKNCTNLYYKNTTFVADLKNLSSNITYVVYDNEGSNMTIAVAKDMLSWGYSVYYLKGGFTAWRLAGIPWCTYC